MKDGLAWDCLQKRDKSQRTAKQIPRRLGLGALHQYLDQHVIEPWQEGLTFELPVLVELEPEMTVIKDLYPLAPEDTSVYHMTNDDEPEDLLDLDHGLTGDTLIEFFNAVSATFDRMRDLEDDFEQEFEQEEEDKP